MANSYHPVFVIVILFNSNAPLTTFKGLDPPAHSPSAEQPLCRGATPRIQALSSDQSRAVSPCGASLSYLCPLCFGRAMSPQFKQWSWDDSYSDKSYS